MKDENIEFKNKLSKINSSPKNPFYAVEYRHELDTSSECTEDKTNFFPNQIGVLP